jgi:intracellular sulfur oxidation DsrE/DsrF family protein
MRVVLHAPSEAALDRARSNARNLRAAQPDAEIMIVVNADGVRAALENRDSETDQNLRICANTLAVRDLTAPDYLTTVPAAVETLALLQIEGWAYIRA